MNYAKENRAFFEKRSPKLYQALYEKRALFPNCQVLENEHGIRFQTEETSCYIESIYDRQAELKDIFKAGKQTTKIVVLLGRITKEKVCYIKKKFPKAVQIIFIEPCRDVFLHYMEHCLFVDMVNAVQPISLTIFCNIEIDEIVSVLQQEVMKTNEIEFFAQISYRTVFREYYAKILKNAVNAYGAAQIRLNTELRHNMEWLWMSFQNGTLSSVSATKLAEFLKGKYVIIVAAGTSLEKNIHLLQEAKEKTVIIAVGSAVRVLYRRGITPHFNIFVDVAQMNMVKMYQEEGFDMSGVPLIFARQAEYEAVRQASQRFYMSMASDAIGRYVIHKTKREEIISDTGPSVANVLFSFLCRVKVKKIIFVGQDFCMYGKQLHAFSGEGIDYTRLLEKEDIYGEKVMVDLGYYSIKEWLDDYMQGEVVKNSSDIDFVNCTEGGLGIKGIENRKLSEVLAEIPAEPINITQSCNAFVNLAMEEAGYYFNDFQMEVLWEEIGQLDCVMEEMLSILKEIARMKRNKAKMQKIDAMFKRLNNRKEKIGENEFFSIFVVANINELLIRIKEQYRIENLRANKSEQFMAKLHYFIAFIAEVQGVCKTFRELYNDAEKMYNHVKECKKIEKGEACV